MNMRAIPHHSVVVIGGGQAGLSVSWGLKQLGLDHVVFEKNRVGHSWRTQRWDSFCLVTPNWQCRLPDFPYAGADPDGFMLRDEIVDYLEAFARKVDAPLREGVGVSRVSRGVSGRFEVATSEGAVTADSVVFAVSGYHRPKIPASAERLPRTIAQLHSSTYRNAGQLPEGAVLVVGSGQSGCQIAEDLHLAGRRVHLVVGSAPRCPRVYRGRDAVAWMHDMGQYDLTVEQHPLKEGVRRNANHYLSGRGGGREIDLRRFALEGMELYGRLTDVDGARLAFAGDLATNLDRADDVYVGIRAAIDRHIAERGVPAPEAAPYAPVWAPEIERSALDLAEAGVTGVVWATGFRADFGWVDLPMFDGAGYPTHARGETSVDGAYVIGLPWLWTWGSGRFSGIARDAEHIVGLIARKAAAQPADVVAAA